MPLTESADLVVEDGTGLADANSYIDVATADDYHRLRDNEAWADADEHTKVAALIRAADYLDRRFRFVGCRLVDGQALEWPREDAFDVDGFDQSEIVPVVVEQAAAEYALRAVDLATRLLPDPPQDETGAQVTLSRERVGPIEEETRYSEIIPKRIIKPYPAADRILTTSGLVLHTAGRTHRA